MPQIPVKSESRAVRVGQVEKLTLAYGEYARIVLLENPTFRYIHNLRAPQIVDGKPVQVTRQKRTKGGDGDDTYKTWEMDFVGRPFCLGADDVLAENGVDPERCPACKRSVESNQVKAPERRFAVNVIRYHQDSSGRPVSPFSCAVIAWAFSEGTFDKLIGLHEEYEASGGLLGRDLRLGPCQSKEFQKFDIMPGDQQWWAASEENKQRVLATYQANKKTEKELESLCGREVTAAWLAEDLGKIADKWRIVDGGGSERPDATAAVDTATVADGLASLSSLLDTPGAATPAPAAQPAAQPAVTPGAAPPELADLLGNTTTNAASSSITPNGSGDAVGFDILDTLSKIGT